MVCSGDIEKGILLRIPVGSEVQKTRVGGDYDVLGKFDGLILYSEVKSSPPKQICAGEVSAFLDRVSDLLPEIAVFFMDTELRMKDKIVPCLKMNSQKNVPYLMQLRGWRRTLSDREQNIYNKRKRQYRQ